VGVNQIVISLNENRTLEALAECRRDNDRRIFGRALVGVVALRACEFKNEGAGFQV